MRALRFLRRWWVPVVAVAGTAIAVTALAFAVPALLATRDQARAGAAARDRTISIAPITCQVYRRQLDARWITPAQFDFLTSRAAGFPGTCQRAGLGP